MRAGDPRVGKLWKRDGDRRMVVADMITTIEQPSSSPVLTGVDRQSGDV